MIKNIKRYLKESEIARSKYLRKLTRKDSICIVENLLSSKLLNYMHFNDDDKPLSLYKQVELNNKARI